MEQSEEAWLSLRASGRGRWWQLIHLPVDGAVWPVTPAAPAQQQPSHQAEEGWRVAQVHSQTNLVLQPVEEGVIEIHNDVTGSPGDSYQAKHTSAEKRNGPAQRQERLHWWALSEGRTLHTHHRQQTSQDRGHAGEHHEGPRYLTKMMRTLRPNPDWRSSSPDQKWWNNKYVWDRSSIPAGRVAEPAEICTAHTDRCLCCATGTPSTAPSCNHWLWWCWRPHKQCCATVAAGWQRPLLQTPGGRGRSQGAEQPFWPCFTRSDAVKCRKSVEKCVGHRRLY